MKKKKRVYIAAFGSGMGHASRMAALAEDLVSTDGDEVMFSSSGEVVKWIEKKGFRCNDIPLVDVMFTDAGEFSATKTLQFCPLILARLCMQLEREVANLGKFAPRVVLSDSVASTVVASKILGIRSVALLNQLRLISSPRTPKTIAKALTAGSVATGSVVWDLCDEILIPDLPPPYTISERNLWKAGRPSERARYIGFMTPKGAAAAPLLPPVTTTLGEADRAIAKWRTERRRKKVFWQISGPPATRGPLLAKALEIAKALAEDHLFVITAGNPRGDTAPLPIQGGFLYQWCNSSNELIDSCDSLISRAGHVSISQFILQAKPSLLVPIQAQTEQLGNASKAKRLGLAIVVDERGLDARVVGEALQALSADSYRRRALEMKEIAEGYDAISAVREVLARG